MLTTNERDLARCAELAALATERSAKQRNNGDDPSRRRWYIVRSVGKSDQYVLDWLKKLNIVTYYPIVLEMHAVPKKLLSANQRRSGVVIKKPMPVPMFPRYIFTQFDMGRHDWHDAFRFVGVGGMVCEGDRPVWVPDSLIERIKGREHKGIVPGDTTARVVFGVGDQVVVTNGPFASFPGTVEIGLDVPIGELDPNSRIKVAVSIFGRATPVQLEVWQVDKR